MDQIKEDSEENKKTKAARFSAQLLQFRWGGHWQRHSDLRFTFYGDDFSKSESMLKEM
jgi:hypothetical protein